MSAHQESAYHNKIAFDLRLVSFEIDIIVKDLSLTLTVSKKDIKKFKCEEIFCTYEKFGKL